jgi:hypothetical protein
LCHQSFYSYATTARTSRLNIRSPGHDERAKDSTHWTMKTPKKKPFYGALRSWSMGVQLAQQNNSNRQNLCMAVDFDNLAIPSTAGSSIPTPIADQNSNTLVSQFTGNEFYFLDLGQWLDDDLNVSQDQAFVDAPASATSGLLESSTYGATHIPFPHSTESSKNTLYPSDVSDILFNPTLPEQTAVEKFSELNVMLFRQLENTKNLSLGSVLRW